MLSKDKENKLLELFMTIDDFCKALENWKQTHPQLSHSVTRHPEMSDSEMMTILVFFQCSGYKCFHRVAGRYYYQHLVAIDLKSIPTAQYLFLPIDFLLNFAVRQRVISNAIREIKRRNVLLVPAMGRKRRNQRVFL